MLMLANNIWVENPALEALVNLFRACARFAASEAQEVFNNLKSPLIHPKPQPASRTTHQPPQKRLNLGPLKRWGVQHDGVSLSTVDYAQNYQDKYNEEYPEFYSSPACRLR
ncbi:hypothetical protein B0H14DRAFT_2621460 [Mycena olivaceomarginata]|nr:hypothetical protein B0H14DRAFT_2621460 [Mycena olivaceomarginata]